MNKPRSGKAFVSPFIVGKIPDKTNLGPCMRKHIDKIINKNIDVIIEQLPDFIIYFPPLLITDDFVIGPFIFESLTGKLIFKKFLFEVVFSLLFIILYP